MMKIIYPAAVALFLFFVQCNQSGNVKEQPLRGEINCRSCDEKDSIYVGIYQHDFDWKEGRPYGDLIDSKQIKAGKFGFSVKPGKYVLKVVAPGADPVIKNILLWKKSSKMYLDIELNPMHIDSLKTVSLVGDFNNWDIENAIQLVMSDDVWMPDELESLEEGSSYGFFINHDFLIPDLQSDVRFNKKAGRLENVYHGGEIRFHANDYPDKGDHSAVEIKKGEETENFDDFSYKLRNIRIAISESYPNFSTAGKLLRDSIYTSLESRLEKLAAKHPGFLQATAETRHMLLLYYHPAEVKLREQGEQMDSTEKKAFFGGKTFEVYKEQKMALLNNLEPSSILLEGKGAFYLHTLSEAVEHVPELISKNTNSEDFRYDFLKSFVVNSTNHRAVENVLTDIAFNYSYEGEKDKALFALTRIKNHYPESDFIKKGRYDRCMTAIKTVAGDQAPDFMLTTLKGDSIRLSAFKGKYVFIDFWGSWCNPCRKEIPHIKKLHASVSKDSLIILGIARDREESLRSFINNNEINYPNMMATEEVLNDYGIMGFPTTFLIDPEGVILEKNLRGKHLTNLIREKMKQS